MFGYNMQYDCSEAHEQYYDPAGMCQAAQQVAYSKRHGGEGNGPMTYDSAAQFDQAGYIMCIMPQAAAPVFERAATEPVAERGALRPTGPAPTGVAAPKPTAPALGRKDPLPLAPLPLTRSVTEPAAKPGAAAPEKRAPRKQDALPQRLTAASMQRQAEKARLLRVLRLGSDSAGGAAPLLLAKRRAQQQAARGDHSTFSALNIDGTPGTAVGEARFLAEMGKPPRTAPEADGQRCPKASPGSQAAAAPYVDPDASTAEEDESPCAEADQSLPGFVASRGLLLAYRRLADVEAPELANLSVGRDRTLSVPAMPPGVFARQRSEPVKLWERQISTSSSLPGTPAFSRMRSCQPASAEELRKREVQSLLNKVCPENVASVIEKMSSMEVRTAAQMEVVIELIFKKALAEPHYCETYADIVFGLKSAFPEFQNPGGSKPMTFKSSVLNICQHEFEELLAAPEPSEDERAKLDPEELDHERQERKKRMRANMRFIGHLFLRQLLSAKVIGSVLCELTLVEQPDILPEEHAIECACELLNAIGFTLESLPAGRAALSAVCGRMHALRYAKTESGKQAYSKRVQFTIQDILDARAADWTRKSFKTSAKTKEDIRLEQERDLHARSNGAEGETVVAGQRPIYLTAASIGLGIGA